MLLTISSPISKRALPAGTLFRRRFDRSELLDTI